MTGYGSIVDLLGERARTQPDHVVARMDEHDLSLGSLEELSARLAGGLQVLQLPPGEHVASLLSNRPEALVTWFGLARAGLVEVPINSAMHGTLLADQLRRADCRAIVVEVELLERVAQVLDLVPQVEHVVVVGSGAAERLPGVRVHRFEQLQKAPPAAPTRRDPDAVSLVLYTSGTTGPSKGVVLTHRANLRLATAVVENVETGPDDVLFTAFPLFHVAARFVSIVPAMLSGGRVVVHRRFSASRFWDICRAEGVTAVHYLGTLPMMLFKQTPSQRDRDHRVRVAYGAGMPPDIWQAFKDRFGIHHILELYGSTEQGIISINTRHHEALGTCGPPVSYASVEIHDEQDLPLPNGSPGEIVVRPEEEGIFFRGYYGMAEETLRAWRNLWFHTADRGKFDSEGNLVFLGRLKDSIRRRGENVSAFEVEQVADAHPAVTESAAVGVPSELGEEEILLVVVPSDSPLDPAEVVHHCAERLPHFAVPRYVRIVDRLPKTPSQRVRKFELGFIDDSTWDRETSGTHAGATENG